MFIHVDQKAFHVEPSWVVTDSASRGMELADIIAISTAMRPIRYDPIDQPFPYEKVALAVYDGLMYSPARRALARRGIPEDQRLTMYPLMDTAPRFRTYDLYQRDIMAAVGLKLAEEWVVVTNIYGLPGSWRFSADSPECRSLLIDYQIGMLPAIPNSLGIILNGMDSDHLALMNDLLAEIGYSPPVQMQVLPDWASIPELILDDRPLRLAPPHDRFAVVTVLLGLVADYMATLAAERQVLFILEYPEVSGHFQTLVNLVNNTPALQWIVISRLESPITGMKVVRW